MTVMRNKDSGTSLYYLNITVLPFQFYDHFVVHQLFKFCFFLYFLTKIIYFHFDIVIKRLCSSFLFLILILNMWFNFNLHCANIQNSGHIEIIL